MGTEAEDDSGPEETEDALARLERALERIGRVAQDGRPDDAAGTAPLAEIAGRLDALIARMRTALADRPGQD